MNRTKRFDIVLTPMGLRFMGRRFPCTIGRMGLTAEKREGDGATPTGTHQICGMLYRPDRISQPTNWAIPIGLRDLWCDDSEAPDYNMIVRAPYAESHEQLRRADPLYDLVILINWNWPAAIKGRGSAIFIHQWRRIGFPTEGCIALARQNLHWIAQRINIGTRLIIG